MVEMGQGAKVGGVEEEGREEWEGPPRLLEKVVVRRRASMLLQAWWRRRVAERGFMQRSKLVERE